MITVLFPILKPDVFLGEAIRSLKAQTASDFRCLLLAGQLTRDESKSLEKIISGDQRFEVVTLKLSGIAFALNYGLNKVNTEYVARMDGDDISHPRRFELQKEFLDTNPEYCVVGSRVELIDELGQVIKKEFSFFEEDTEIRSALKYRMPLCHPSLLMRTSTLHKVKGYMYGNNAEDHELFLRMARDKTIKFKNLPETLLKYRRHSAQSTSFSNAFNAYINISGFMFTEFLLSKNPLYLIGAFANYPRIRSFRNKIKNKFKV